MWRTASLCRYMSGTRRPSSDWSDGSNNLSQTRPIRISHGPLHILKQNTSRIRPCHGLMPGHNMAPPLGGCGTMRFLGRAGALGFFGRHKFYLPRLFSSSGVTSACQCSGPARCSLTCLCRTAANLCLALNLACLLACLGPRHSFLPYRSFGYGLTYVVKTQVAKDYRIHHLSASLGGHDQIISPGSTLPGLRTRVNPCRGPLPAEAVKWQRHEHPQLPRNTQTHEHTTNKQQLTGFAGCITGKIDLPLVHPHNSQVSLDAKVRRNIIATCRAHSWMSQIYACVDALGQAG
ncbi:hypothetical protein GGS20DRAFT_166673 [Poronia punctata]|nr:hypothetical protein GGS20DRAFT_166673 [Poronia punctata]